MPSPSFNYGTDQNVPAQTQQAYAEAVDEYRPIGYAENASAYHPAQGTSTDRVSETTGYTTPVPQTTAIGVTQPVPQANPFPTPPVYPVGSPFLAAPQQPFHVPYDNKPVGTEKFAIRELMYLTDFELASIRLRICEIVANSRKATIVDIENYVFNGNVGKGNV